MEKSGYFIDNVYQGGYSSLDPNKSYGNVFSGYRVTQGLGMSTDARTANIIKEVSKNLSAGAKTVELTQVFPEVFEAIPKSEFKELNRLAKLTGVEITFHAPLVEPSGLTRDGFSEANRKSSELQMLSAVEKAHEINPKGNIPVTFHSSNQLPGKIKPKEGEISETLIINPETGQIHPLPLKERFFPGEEKKPDVKVELQKLNEEQWDHQLRNLVYYSDMGMNAIDESKYLALGAEAEQKAGQQLTEQEKRAMSGFNRGVTFLNESYREFKKIYDQTYPGSSPEDKKKLEEFSQKIKEKAIKITENKNTKESIALRKEILEEGINILGQISPPQMFKPLEEYAKEKTTETFSNVALQTYNKFKDNSPIISIENPPAGGAFSRGEELKEIVEESRKKFVEKAIKGGMSQSEAESASKKLIGATWDVGHINMLRKYGYTDEDIIKETEKIAPLVKHVHLSDNFGFEHTELPMGMGNVPIKAMMEKLGKEGYKGKKIIEALHWWQHFSEQGSNPPFKPSLEAMGSPLYSTGLGPYWNAAIGFQQNYFGGYGATLPQGNYNIFGGGFSALPAELGGQVPGSQGGRMSGRPME